MVLFLKAYLSSLLFLNTADTSCYYVMDVESTKEQHGHNPNISYVFQALYRDTFLERNYLSDSSTITKAKFSSLSQKYRLTYGLWAQEIGKDSTAGHAHYNNIVDTKEDPYEQYTYLKICKDTVILYCQVKMIFERIPRKGGDYFSRRLKNITVLSGAEITSPNRSYLDEILKNSSVRK